MKLGGDLGIELEHRAFTRKQQHLALRTALELLCRPIWLREGPQLVVIE
jgi:hypothetical protein